MGTKLGVSSEDANQLLRKAVFEVIEEFERDHGFSVVASLKGSLDVRLAVTLCVALCFFAACYMLGKIHYLVSGLLVVLSVLLNASLLVWKHYLRHHETVRLLRARLERDVLHKSELRSVHFFSPPVDGKVYALRDGRKYILPYVLLVEGDIIEVASLRGARFKYERIPSPPQKETPPEEAHEGQRPPLSRSAEPGIFFRVLETPCIEQLRNLLHSTAPGLGVRVRKPLGPMLVDGNFVQEGMAPRPEPGAREPDLPPPTLFSTQYRLVQAVSLKMLGIGLVLYVVVTVIRLTTMKVKRPEDWVAQLVGNVAVLAMPLLLLSNPLWMFVLDAVGNSVLLNTHLKVMIRDLRPGTHRPIVKPNGQVVERSHISISSDAYSDSAIEDDDAAVFEMVDALGITWQETMLLALKVARGTQPYVVRRVNPLQTIGGITVFCCLDNRGVLSENEPSADHVLLLDDQSSTGTTVLDLINTDTSATGIEFEGEWQQHLSRLVPMGINITLNNSCNLPHRSRSMYQLHNHQWQRDGEGDGGSLCDLSKEIGLDLDAVRRRFPVQKVFYDFMAAKKKHCDDIGHEDHDEDECDALDEWDPLEGDGVHSMVMTAVSERSATGQKKVQLMTSGDPGIVLYNCREAWDGKTVEALSSVMRQKVFEILQQWTHQDLHCIALSYSPIPEEFHEIYSKDNVYYMYQELPADVAVRDLMLGHLHPQIPGPLGTPESSTGVLASPESSTKAGTLLVDKAGGLSDIAEVSKVGALSDIAEGHPKSPSPSPEGNISPEGNNSPEGSNPSLLSSAKLPVLDITTPHGTSMQWELRPMTEADEPVPAPAGPNGHSLPQLYKWLQKEQVFLGMVALRDQPKVSVVTLVQELMGAGIRFVYFSPNDERRTLAFGSQIGLLTDFNQYICLRDGKKYYRQGPARMPCGVSNIRSHLQEVDNVPLLVSLFTLCDPENVHEMIRIYQENGESVMCLGSSLKQNQQVFLQANISASLEPAPTQDCDHNVYPAHRDRVEMHDSFEYALASTLTGLPTVFRLHTNTDLRQFTALICEGRRLLRSLYQCLWFAMSAYTCLFIALLLDLCAAFPPLLNGVQVAWLVWVVVPALSVTLLATPREPQVMREVSDKNYDELGNKCRAAFYLVSLMVPSALSYCFVFFWVLRQMLADNFDGPFYEHLWESQLWEQHEMPVDVWDGVVLSVQAAAMLPLVIVLAVHSMSFVYRTASIRKENPCENHLWRAVCAACILLQICVTIFTIVAADLPAELLVRLLGASWHVAIMLLVWCIAVVVVAEVVKAHAEKRRKSHHRKAMMQFETVLGMHSPK